MAGMHSANFWYACLNTTCALRPRSIQRSPRARAPYPCCAATCRKPVRGSAETLAAFRLRRIPRPQAGQLLVSVVTVNSAVDYAIMLLPTIIHWGFILLEVLQGLKGKNPYTKVEIQPGQRQLGYSIQVALNKPGGIRAYSDWKIRDKRVCEPADHTQLVHLEYPVNDFHDISPANENRPLSALLRVSL